MLNIVDNANAIKNKLEIRNAFPAKYSNNEIKNGLREKENTPFVISFPRLLESIPNRRESLKDKRVRNKIARANSCKNIPMVCIKKESDKGVINHSGKTRKGIGYTGLKISIIYNPTAKINRR